MAYEIERKFLVKGEFAQQASGSKSIAQGYLNSDPMRTVRIRTSDKEAFLTIKGPGNESGTSRYEWETSIDPVEASELLQLCEPGVIEKTRYLVPCDGHTFEVDVFAGANEGLIIAEVELDNENEAFTKPEWLGEEVTGENRYYNSALSKKPFKKWYFYKLIKKVKILFGKGQ